MAETVILKLNRYASMKRPPLLLVLLLFSLTTTFVARAEDRLPHLTVNTELVQVSLVVLDKDGRVATGLTQRDFEVFEDGVKQNLVECMSETSPVSAALVLDKSRSMRSNLPLVTEGAFNVLDSHLQADDEFLLVVFDNVPKVIYPHFIGDADLAKHLISTNLTEAKGLTSLFDALYIAVSNVKQQAKNPRRAAILITDGGDTHSVYTQKEVREYLEESDVPVFAINASEPNIFQNWTVKKNGKVELATDDAIGPAERDGPKILKDLTGATGGAVFTAHDPSDIPRIMGVVYDLISNQYTLFFKPRATTSGLGGRHKIQVKLVAEDNRFDGYHLTYKRQYYRPADRDREPNTLSALPSH